MALISKDNFTKTVKDRNSVHSRVKATYTAFTANGEQYFQIDTYGKPSRECKDKLSQSLQLDKDSAKMLCELLNEIFEL